jgi:ERCC4-type nuclease
MIKTITIIQDTREKKPWKFRKCTWCSGTIVEKVDTGDYTIKEVPNLIAIERKSGYNELCTNFTNSDYRRRIFAEMERMQEYKHKFLIVECTLDDIVNPLNYKYLRGRIKNIAPNIILGTLAAIQLKYGVHVIFAGDKGREYAARLFRKAFEYYMKEQIQDEARRHASEIDIKDNRTEVSGEKD